MYTLKNVYSTFFGGEDDLKIPIKFMWSNVSFKAVTTLHIFCLKDLPIDVNRVLKFSTMTVLLLLSPFMPIVICFIYLGAPESSRQDVGIGRNTSLLRTTKRRITTNLKPINNQKCQKIKLHGTPTTKD